MDPTVALITGVLTIFPLVLGGSFWASYRGLIKDLRERVIALEEHNKTLQSKIDTLEAEYFEERLARIKTEEELKKTQDRVDHYVAIAQIAQNEMERLQIQNDKYHDVMGEVIKQISAQLYIASEDDGLDREPQTTED